MKLVAKVSKNTAKNPVARAIAKQKLREAVTTQRIAIFLRNDGEDFRDTALTLALPMYAVMMCFEETGEDSPDMRKLKGGCAVLKQISETGFVWRKEYAISLDNALEICERRWAGFPVEMLNKALNTLESVG